MRSVLFLAIATLATLATAACSSDRDEPAPAPIAPPHDAGTIVSSDAVSVIVGFDPHSGMHLDDDSPPRIGVRPTGPAAVRQHPIDVTLRSSPSGALAAVDGVPIGTTPSFWAGDANGREHEFTFVLAGYAVARYRFVPITSGVIHARLDAVADDVDAGVDEVGPRWTAPSPTALPAPPPPPTLVAPRAPIVAPDAAAPAIAPDAASASASASAPPDAAPAATSAPASASDAAAPPPSPRPSTDGLIPPAPF